MGALRLNAVRIRLRYALGAALVFAMASGCSTSSVRAITDADQTIRSNGFTVAAPKGGDWFLEESLYGIAFYRKPQTDVFIAPSGRSSAVPRTFFILVSLMRPNVVDLSSPQALEAALARLIRDDPGADRRLVDSRITRYVAEGTDCARYEATYEERNRPVAPEAVFEVTGRGFLCRHPDAAQQAIHGSWSERRLKGAPAHGDFELAADDILRSVRFHPPR